MNKRVLYYDILNVLSCISVVCLHSNGYFHDYIKDGWWWLRVFIEVVFYFAVPVFFMLSGATLLNYRKRYSTKVFLRKRLLKTFMPYCLWGCGFYLLHICIVGLSEVHWKEVVENFTIGKIPYTSYWFFIHLFLLYLFIPFLSVMVNNMSKRMIFVLCLLLFVLQSLLPMIYSFLSIGFDLPLPIGGYVLYALLEYYFANTDVENNNTLFSLLGTVALLSLVFRYFGIFCATGKDMIWFSYMGFYAIFPATFVFLLIKRLAPFVDKWGNLWTSLSRRSFGVYLIHVFLIVLLAKVISKANPWFIPISILFVYASSVAIVATLQRVKFMRYLLP